MKNIILIMACMLLTATSIKATEIPDAIEKAFQEKYPTAKKVKWEKENNNDYEASFVLENKEMSVVYSPDAQIKEIETEIAVAEIPNAVLEAFNKKYTNAKIEEAAKIERSDKSIVYEIESKINKKEIDLLFDENGNEVK